MDTSLPFVLVGGIMLVALGVLVLVLRSAYQKVPQGQALVVSSTGGRVRVSFTGSILIPLIERAELLDVSLKQLTIVRSGKEGLICRDNIRADVTAQFFLRVNPTSDDVIRVARSIGCARAGDPATLESLFVAKLSEALKIVAKRLEFTELYSQREEFRELVIETIGADLNGFVLEDLALDYLEQTPIEQLDPQNILDAEGIRKIRALSGSTGAEGRDAAPSKGSSTTSSGSRERPTATSKSASGVAEIEASAIDELRQRLEAIERRLETLERNHR